jgi:predicted NodU family carbamoyl transferase
MCVGEPIVRSPLGAFQYFIGTKMEVLVIGNAILQKGE